MSGTGIYLHIPFCVKKCRYCNFDSIPAKSYDQSFAERYIKCMIAEIRQYAENNSNININLDSVFFGGGTPSILDGGTISSILLVLRESFTFSNDCEITIEVNPGTADEGKLMKLFSAGINRVSIGAQSLQDSVLVELGRIHDRDDILNIIDISRNTGFNSIGLDFIFAFPGQEGVDWRSELDEIIKLSPEHLSVYCLTPEEGTPLGDDIIQGRISMPTDDETADMMDIAEDLLRQAGYERYEISNYARPGFKCRHNIKYWLGDDYKGFGSSAVSYENRWRYSNVRDPFEYVRRIENNENPVEYGERLSTERQMGEYMMMALRMPEGVFSDTFLSRFSEELDDVYGEEINELLSSGFLKKREAATGGFFIFIPDGMLSIHNEIAERFIKL